MDRNIAKAQAVPGAASAVRVRGSTRRRREILEGYLYLSPWILGFLFFVGGPMIASLILSLTEPSQVLCFARTPEGATDIVRGSHHPRLREWRGETDLGTLFASGVLG